MKEDILRPKTEKNNKSRKIEFFQRIKPRRNKASTNTKIVMVCLECVTKADLKNSGLKIHQKKFTKKTNKKSPKKYYRTPSISVPISQGPGQGPE